MKVGKLPIHHENVPCPDGCRGMGTSLLENHLCYLLEPRWHPKPSRFTFREAPILGRGLPEAPASPRIRFKSFI